MDTRPNQLHGGGLSEQIAALREEVASLQSRLDAWDKEPYWLKVYHWNVSGNQTITSRHSGRTYTIGHAGGRFCYIATGGGSTNIVRSMSTVTCSGNTDTSLCVAPVVAGGRVYARLYTGATNGTWSAGQQITIAATSNSPMIVAAGSARLIQLDYTVFRQLGSNSWRFLGSLGYGGTLSTQSFDIEAAAADGVVPTLYTAGWDTVVTSSLSYLEILEG